MLADSIVMLDFETTGLSPAAGDRITEVAALRISGGEIVERFVTLINCGVRIPGHITQLTGISQRMVDSAPPVSSVMPALLDFIGDAPLSAHNASFDLRFLIAESQRLQCSPRHRHLLCSLKLARRIFPGLHSYRLASLATSRGIVFSGAAHRAEADAEVSARLLLDIGGHLACAYGVPAIDSAILARANELSAAKVPAYLQAALAHRAA